MIEIERRLDSATREYEGHLKWYNNTFDVLMGQVNSTEHKFKDDVSSLQKSLITNL